MTQHPRLVTPAGELLSGPQNTPKVSEPPALKQEPTTPERDWTEVPFPIALFNDKIAISRDDREERTEGGIILPDRARERTMTGTVVAVGPGFQKGDGSHVPMNVEVGDKVVFHQYREMTEVRVEGRDYHLMASNDLLGKVIGGVKVKKGGSPNA